ncbi:MAG: methyltransferase domain-containing protein [Proteobacteria bacterium]|nr:methyltransferase domain-containing protein [Pseudomonadota bacterium]
MAWNPSQYLKFAQPRFRPAQDLLARIDAEDPQLVYDLGCGTGNGTQLLALRWNLAKVTGIDDSEEMLGRAAKEQPLITWQQQSIAQWVPEQPADLIFSNAALHWLPDHADLFPKLMAFLAPGGTLAVQMPRNFGAPSHTLIAETIRGGHWRSRLEHLLRPAPVGDPIFYYELLAPSASSIDIWETEYLQVLDGKNPVKEWTKGTWLKQFLDPLDISERLAFEEDYAGRVELAYPPQPDGKTLFPFRRLFMVVQKKR